MGALFTEKRSVFVQVINSIELKRNIHVSSSDFPRYIERIIYRMIKLVIMYRYGIVVACISSVDDISLFGYVRASDILMLRLAGVINKPTIP